MNTKSSREGVGGSTINKKLDLDLSWVEGRGGVEVVGGEW
jgi:hypothetical protein